MKTFLFVMIGLLFASCSIVGPQDRGVRIYLGEATSVKTPGIYLWIPWVLGMDKVDLSVQKSEVETSAASKDMQEITAKLAINWEMDDELLLATYKKVGNEVAMFHRVIDPQSNEVLKAMLAQYPVEEILAKRVELKSKIDKMLQERCVSYGARVRDVNIVNLKFSPDFEKSIEAKQVEEQKAKKAVYTAQESEQLAQSRINQARGEAEAQKLLNVSINDNILRLKALEKWDGKLPQVSGGATPFINVGK